MGSSFRYCLALVSITLIGGIVSRNFREDYCELYLNASKISAKSCHNNGSYIVTNEYELTLSESRFLVQNSFTNNFFEYDRGELGIPSSEDESQPAPSYLLLNWTTNNLIEWNSVAITNKMLNLTYLKVVGIRSSEDHRLRPASFYLKKLIVENVDEFKINTEQIMIKEEESHCEMGPRSLWVDFKRSVHLGQINDYVAASTKRIRKIYIKGLHLPGSELCSHVQFFNLPELQENVVLLDLDVNMTVNMKCFQNYRKLTYIIIQAPYEPFENLTALICNYWMECKFTIGRNGIRCPANCTCTHNNVFQIYCRDRINRQIPPLPIPIDYQIHLIYKGMQLIELPNNTLTGYMEVITLDVSANKISSLAVHQLPRKLELLDISYNPITTIDNGVVSYLKGHSTIVSQIGIKWIANCDERTLVKLLQGCSYHGNVFFEKLNGECPKKCQCCFYKETENFVINCSSKDVNFPILPDRVPYKLTLLLGNCSIKELPKNLSSLVKTDNIIHLDLRKNFLKSLDEETVDFYNKHDNTTIELSGNPWRCICKPRSFLFFLKGQNPAEYSSALERCKIPMCPEHCVCCLDNLNSSSLTVDCRGQRLTQFPLLPDSVTSLDLGNNDIMEIDLQSQAFLKNKALSAGFKIFLSGNPWTCICDKNDLVAFAKSISPHISDFAEMECSNLGKRLALVEDSEVCPSYFKYYVLLFVFSMTIITVLNVFVYFKQPILMWFYEHEICMSMAVRMDLERTKKFDAFVSFTHKDENLIEEYVERLENGHRKFRLCFYLRDWNIGASIPECIIQSVTDSRRIIILMTKNFLESTWGKLEFRLALHATTKDRCKRLIVIVYPDVENFDDLDSELKAYMVLNTYLRRDNPNFWNKLVYSMPHIS